MIEKFKIKIISLLFLALVITSCESSEIVVDRYTSILEEITYVSGMNLYRIDGSLSEVWRQSNDRNISATVFPNPLKDEAIISSNRPFNKIWIVPAVCTADSTYENFEEIMEKVDFKEELVGNSAVVEYTPDLSTTDFTLDFTALSEGFYKVFWQHEKMDDLQWQNIYNFKDDIPSDPIAYFETLCIE